MLYQSGIFKTYKFNTKIISIGNISFGGTGKTPLTIKIANNLKKNNYKVSILSRGYKRKNENLPKIVFDGEKFLTNLEESGDEPYLIAQNTLCPVVVSSNRVEGAKILIKKFNPDFIILDDAFQHLKIYRDKDIVLISQKELDDNFFLFRETFSSIKRADCIIITKITDLKILKRNYLKIKKFTNSPVYLANFEITNFKCINTNEMKSKDYFLNKEIVAFCGIGSPEFFKNQLKEMGIKLKKFLKFKDHHNYTSKDYDLIYKFKNFPIITTEKDAIKLKKDIIENLEIYYANLTLQIKSWEELRKI